MYDDGKNQKLLSLIRQLISNNNVEKEELAIHFDAAAYTMAVSRKNNLPGRFLPKASNFRYLINEASYDISGRDEMESIHICSDDSIISQDAFSRINWLHSDIPGYTTTVVCTEPFPIEKLPEIVKLLYSVLDCSLSIGVTQVIPASVNRQIPGTAELKNEYSCLLDQYLREKKIPEILKLFSDFLEKCKQAKYPQIHVEKSIKHFIEKILYEIHHSVREDELEFLIDDVFFHASGYEELNERILGILERLFREQYGNINKVDSPEFFELIREYISLHLPEKLTLLSMCKHFGISQTYISRLFRKYTGKSFVNYLKEVRIEKAKQYLANQEILIKDAAAMAGFNDQFYFSRIFRSFSGLSPSKYQQNQKNFY